MKNITLYIETRDGLQEISLEDEISIGRTELANVVVDDVGLSRVNTTFFRDGEMLLIIDEGSLNGTFLNGEKVGNRPVRVLDGDVIKIGSETEIRVEFEGEKQTIQEKSHDRDQISQKEETKKAPPKPKPKPQPATSNKPPMVLIVAGLSTFAIVFFTIIALVIVSQIDTKKGGNPPIAQIGSRSDIPRRVIDPLGGVDPDDIEDIFSSWEVQDKEIDVDTVEEITETADNELESANLNVPIELFKRQMARSKAGRNAPTGNDPPGQIVPPELRNPISKQIAKINALKSAGYKLPMDYAGLAQKRAEKRLVEMPIATEDYVLDVGGSADGSMFNTFSFFTNPRSAPVIPGTPEYQTLVDLATSGYGQKYDINNGDDRRQIKRRLLRMFHPNVKPVLEKLAKDYREKFNYPLRVTSLSRSMEYQISLNSGNANSYRVRNADAVPPHTSGCTFDLSRKFMTADEQNFIMQELAVMEQQGKVDALREGGINACFHVFILQGCEA